MSKEKSQIKLGIVLNYINLLLGNLIPVFYTPIMLEILGQNEYGLYKLSSNVTSYLSLISLGIGGSIARYLIKARTESGKEEEQRVLGLFTIIFLVIGGVCLIAGGFLVGNLDIWYADALTSYELLRMKMLVFLMVINTAIGFAASPYAAVPVTHERFLFVQSANIISTCGGPLLNLLVLFGGGKSLGMTVMSLVIQIVTRIIYYIYVRRVLQIRIDFRNVPVHMIKEILIFSFWSFLASVAGQLYNATDTAMIGAIPALGTAGVAVYNIGATFNSIELSLSTGVSNMMSPRTNKMVFSGATTQELSDLAIRIGRIQTYIVTLVVSGFFAFGQPFIYFYAGKGYEEAYWVTCFLVITGMIPAIQSTCLSIITAQNKHQFRSLVYLLIAIINVVLTWYVLRPWGIVGAAAMTSVAVLLGHGFIMNWYYHKKIGLDIPRFWKETGRIMFVPTCMCIITLLISNRINFYSIGTMLTGIVTYTLVYALLNWLFVMNDYEKGIITSIWNGIKARVRAKNS
jgi:O-antigen/teichoic acid export membrane protein